MLDLHFHSGLSCDGQGKLEEFCEHALRHGVRYLAPTEHLDLDPQDPGYGFLNCRKARKSLRAAQRAYRGRLTLASGLELDYQERFQREAEAFLAEVEFDFLLRAVHVVEGVPVLSREYCARHTEIEAYRAYFRAVLSAARGRGFDALAHLDLLKRYAVPVYGAYKRERCAEQIEEILRELVARGTALEVNSSGLFQAPAESYPDALTVTRFRELGGELVTVGSDAHAPEAVGRGIGATLRMVRRAGFKRVAFYRARRPEWLEL